MDTGPTEEQYDKRANSISFDGAVLATCAAFGQDYVMNYFFVAAYLKSFEKNPYSEPLNATDMLLGRSLFATPPLSKEELEGYEKFGTEEGKYFVLEANQKFWGTFSVYYLMTETLYYMHTKILMDYLMTLLENNEHDIRRIIINQDNYDLLVFAYEVDRKHFMTTQYTPSPMTETDFDSKLGEIKRWVESRHDTMSLKSLTERAQDIENLIRQEQKGSICLLKAFGMLIRQTPYDSSAPGVIVMFQKSEYSHPGYHNLSMLGHILLRLKEEDSGKVIDHKFWEDKYGYAVRTADIQRKHQRVIARLKQLLFYNNFQGMFQHYVQFIRSNDMARHQKPWLNFDFPKNVDHNSVVHLSNFDLFNFSGILGQVATWDIYTSPEVEPSPERSNSPPNIEEMDMEYERIGYHELQGESRGNHFRTQGGGFHNAETGDIGDYKPSEAWQSKAMPDWEHRSSPSAVTGSGVSG